MNLGAGTGVAAESYIDMPFGRGRIALKTWHADARGVPIVALHGWMDNAATFDRMAPLLADHPFVAMDLPGHGLSDPRPAGFRYHNADYFDDVLAVLDALYPQQKVILLGHSLGAGIQMMLAGLLPERVQALVMIEGLGPLTADPSHYVEMTRLALASYRDFRPGRRPIADEAQAVQARMNGLTGALSEMASRILCSRSLDRNAEGELFWRTDKRLRQNSLMRFNEAQVLACIRAISVPVLLIRGQDGAPFEQAAGKARLEAFADLRQVTVAGKHHLHLDESPAEVAAQIRAFFSSIALVRS
ncbi:MAG: alpha/beta hydrolase [Pseudomonadota bacterium]